MNIAVKFFSDLSESENPQGLPASRPAQTMELGDSATPPDDSGWTVMTLAEYQQLLVDTQEDYDTWLAAQEVASEESNVETYYKKVITHAQDFGSSILLQFSTENVLMGITQAGKVGAVADFLHKLSHYIMTGSLYQARTEIDRLITAGLPEELSPFITEERLLSYKQRITDYLS